MPFSPPIDPSEDTRRQEAAATGRSHLVAMGAMAFQFTASFFLGIWAALAAVGDDETTLAMLAGAACAFGWAGVLAVTHALRMAVGSVFFAMSVPGLVKRFTGPPGAWRVQPPDPREQRLEFWLHVVATAFNIVMLMALCQLVAIGVAAFSAVTFGALWWRFALLGAFLGLFSWKALQVDG